MSNDRDPNARRDPLALASLVAVGVVVALVSLPSLRSFALRQNEADAMHIGRALALAAADCEAPLDGTPLDAATVLAEVPELRHRFGDLEAIEGGRLRCHGYLFELVVEDGRRQVRAWPWAHGRTGFAAFAVDERGALWGSPNEAGALSGAAPSAADWPSLSSTATEPPSTEAPSTEPASSKASTWRPLAPRAVHAAERP